MSENLIGVDIGGTKILMAQTDLSGSVKKRVEVPTTGEQPEKILADICAVIKSFGKSRSVGVGIAGDVDSANGILRFSPNMPKWINVGIKRYVEKKTGLPCCVENDANCAAYGSFVIDGGRKYRNFVTITLGTGVGGGIIIDGKIYRGSTGSAGEIGHITIDPDGPLCGCGHRGCLEAHIGTAGIKNIAKKIGFKAEKVTPATIAAAAENGDKKALAVYKKVGEYLAVGVGGIINVLNPDMISFSGGVANNFNLFEADFRRELKERAFKTPLEHVKIARTKNIKNLGVIGAALIFSKEGN